MLLCAIVCAAAKWPKISTSKIKMNPLSRRIRSGNEMNIGLIYQYGILVFWILVGISLILFSTRIVNWMWQLSGKFWKRLGVLIGRSEQTVIFEQQSQAPVWIIRIFGFLAAAMAVYFLINTLIL
jgi:hypothetical protein